MSRDSYGLLAEFDDAGALLTAARSAREQGYRAIDAYTPFRVEGLSEAVGMRPTRVPLLALFGGMLGAAVAYFIQYYSAVMGYPLNVGGRPLHSWPAFMPATVILCLLGAGVFTVITTLWENGLPKLYHPLFNVPAFERASREGFFLCIRATDNRFDVHATRRALLRLGARDVWDVPP